MLHIKLILILQLVSDEPACDELKIQLSVCWLSTNWEKKSCFDTMYAGYTQICNYMQLPKQILPPIQCKQ